MRSPSRLVLLVLTVSLGACTAPAPEEVPAELVVEVQAPSGVIDIKAEEFAFTAPPTFPSGWVTLNFNWI